MYEMFLALANLPIQLACQRSTRYGLGGGDEIQSATSQELLDCNHARHITAKREWE